jgi:hypothetical protein
LDEADLYPAMSRWSFWWTRQRDPCRGAEGCPTTRPIRIDESSELIRL